MFENSFSIEKVIILDDNFKAAINSFESITTYETIVDSQNYGIWQVSTHGDWIWGFDAKGYWYLKSIGEYNSPDTVNKVLEVIAPFLSDISIITMFDNNCNNVARAFIRFIVKNGVIQQQNAVNYWPSY